MAPLLAEEVIKHSAYNTINYDLPATTSGSCTVAQNRRGGPLNINYEIHGTGPVKLVVSTSMFYDPMCGSTDMGRSG